MDVVLLQTIQYGVVGGVCGGWIAFSVGCSLLEISTNPAFSLVFGACLLLLGLIVGWRAAFPDVPSPRLVRLLTSISAAMIISAGVFCVLLEKDWFSTTSSSVKIPMYAVLGASLSYSISFTVGDLINQGIFQCKCCEDNEEAVTPIVSNQQQMLVIAVAGLGGGAVIGSMFGIDAAENSYLAFMVQEQGSMVLGAAIGALAGSSINLFKDTVPIEISSQRFHDGDGTWSL